MLDFSRFRLMTFDCYGTLIDWETGILCALRPILAAHLEAVPPDDNVLGLYAAIESEIEAGPYRSYHEVLQQVVRDFGARLGFVPSVAETLSLAESIAGWCPFPDTVEALQRLATRYQLVILSNIDDDLFALTAPQLGVRFADVITAQQARSYKPSLNNFDLALQRTGASPDDLLHVAQSLYHDVVPARQLGIATVWINRHTGRNSLGATPPAPYARPDAEFPDLHSLAQAAVPLP